MCGSLRQFTASQGGNLKPVSNQHSQYSLFAQGVAECRDKWKVRTFSKSSGSHLGDPDNMVKRCICEICTCGRHRCPHRPAAPIAGRGDQCKLSEYTERYKKHPILPTQSFKPNEEPIRGQGRMEGVTTFKKDYVPYKVTKIALPKAEEYVPIPGNMDLLSSYKQEYIGHTVPVVKPIRHEPQRKVDAGRMDTVPTYKTDYRKWEIQRAAAHKPMAAYKPSEGHMEEMTTFRHDYTRKNIPLTVSFKPLAEAKVSDIPFDDRTEYKTGYVPKPLEPKQQREREMYRPSGVPFDGMTTQKRDFTKKQGPKTESFKPDQVAMQSRDPFQGDTEFKTQFKKWATQPYVPHAGEAYVKPVGEMDLRTTHGLEYRGHVVPPARPARPPSRQRATTAPFDDKTTFKDSFRRWEIERVGPKIHQDAYHRPDVPFEGTTTFRAHYIKHPQAPTQSFKPDLGAYQSEAPFEDRTEYKGSYTPKKADICPAVFLPGTGSGWAYETDDQRGHKLFRRMSQTTKAMEMNTSMNSFQETVQPLASTQPQAVMA
ncbi:hypothetical protein Bbelb_390540 [Branchiostoma belcheri]|nr:hypothetical protein Bbelb_390540 [Branchiostoma belcheri]